MMNMELREIKGRLTLVLCRAVKSNIQKRCKAALAKVRAAETLLDQAQSSLIWLEREMNPAQQTETKQDEHNS